MDTTAESLIRSLTVLADGETVSGYSRAWLTGGERMGLFPWLFTLCLWNLPEEGSMALSRCRTVSVLCGDAVLVTGAAAGAVRRNTRQGTVTTVCFSPGLALWEARVSLSVEAGASVYETVKRLLQASGTGVRLLSSEGMDRAFARSQAFCGRAAECIEEALSLTGARTCTVPSGLCVVPASGVPVTMALGEGDLSDAPEFPSPGRMILRTRTAGWTLGKHMRVRRDGMEYTGWVRERFFDLDTGDGPWRTELVLRLE